MHVGERSDTMRLRAQMPRVLLIEHEPTVRSFIEFVLKKNGFEVVGVGDCVQPSVPHDCHLDCCGSSGTPDVVIAAVLSPRPCSGMESAAKAINKWKGVKVLLISASSADFPEIVASPRAISLPKLPT